MTDVLILANIAGARAGQIVPMDDRLQKHIDAGNAKVLAEPRQADAEAHAHAHAHDHAPEQEDADGEGLYLVDDEDDSDDDEDTDD